MPREQRHLVSLVSQILDSHLGISDKILSEYIVAVYNSTQSLHDFKLRLQNQLESNDLVVKLYTLISSCASKPIRNQSRVSTHSVISAKRSWNPEPFETKQLVASGLLPPPGHESEEQEIEIELKVFDASFLRSFIPTKRDHGAQRPQPQEIVSPVEINGHLPVFQVKDHVMDAIQNNQVVVIVGETGSGKTTQIPQYLLERGVNGNRIIACTQPRRVAAISVAKRVACELGSALGETAGYTVRFQNCTSPSTVVKYMTDGMMLRECLVDPLLSRYSVVMVDEAHERSIHTDFLVAWLKRILPSRKDLRIVISSATLDSARFSWYFDCPVFVIPGKTWPVEIVYVEPSGLDHVDSALNTILDIHVSEPKGDILLFLTGQEEIDAACLALKSKAQKLDSKLPKLLVLPVYSALSSDQQSRIFDPAPKNRKVVVATNIAETSITIEGIRYVVDCGLVKQKAHNPHLKMDSLTVIPISQAQAMQRSGRAGRTCSGKAYRMYTEQTYLAMRPSAIPEIQRSDLSGMLLILKAMGIDHLENFEFMDPPSASSLQHGLEFLYHVGALDMDGKITKLGRSMANLPLEPALAKVLVRSVELGCTSEILTIVAMLSVQNVFRRPKGKESAAESKKARFNQTQGDHCTLLAVYGQWRDNGYSRTWCEDHYLEFRNLVHAKEIREQLYEILGKPRVSTFSDRQKAARSIISGFFFHVARRDPVEGYKTLVGNQSVFIHPASSLFCKNPEWVVYHELVQTAKEYMREVTAIDPLWLVEETPSLFRMADPLTTSKKRTLPRLQPLHTRRGVNPR